MSNAATKLPSRTPFTFVVNVWKSFRNESGLERHLFAGKLNPRTHLVSITNAVQGKVEFEVHLQERHTNRLKILHGGTIASLVDTGGSLAVASKGLFSTGVSTDLNVSYLGSGGKAGDKIKVEARCDKMGGTLAFTTVKVFNEDGRLVARGSHTKYIKDAHEAQTQLGGRYKYPSHVKAELDARQASKLAKAAQSTEGAAVDADTDAVQATSEGDRAQAEEAIEEVKATEQSTGEEKTKE